MYLLLDYIDSVYQFALFAPIWGRTTQKTNFMLNYILLY